MLSLIVDLKLTLSLVRYFTIAYQERRRDMALRSLGNLSSAEVKGANSILNLVGIDKSEHCF